MNSPSYLKKRGDVYFVRVPVPRHLQEAVGYKERVRSLHTRSEAEALRRRHAVIAELQGEWEEAAALPATGTPQALLQEAHVLRRQVDRGSLTKADAEASMDGALDALLSKEARKRGINDEGHPLLPPDEVATIRRAHDILAGRRDTGLARLAAEHLAELESDDVLRPSTRKEKQRRIEDFIGWFGENRSWKEVRRGVAVDYLAHLKTKRLGKGGNGKLSHSSLVKWLSDLRVFFRWILDREDADTRPSNPFDGLQPKRSVRGKESAHREWTEAEVATLLRGLPKDDPMWPLAALAAYSGARIEELSSLRIESVERESFSVTEGKRQASVRRVPVHPVVAPLLSRLVATSVDGYVIPGLLQGGYDNKRSVLIGKRIGYAIRKLGISDPRVVFHSLRNTVETQMIAKGVSLERAQLIVGHERLGSSAPYVGRGSVQDVESRRALELVSYGELDSYVSDEGAKASISAKSRRRPRF